MTPAERQLLVVVAQAVRALLAEEQTGSTIARRERVRMLDTRLADLSREDQAAAAVEEHQR